MYSMRKSINFDSSSRTAGKPQKMHRLCGTRKGKESSAVGWFGSINYLTKPLPRTAHLLVLLLAHLHPLSRCSAGVLAPKHRPLVPSMFPSPAQLPPFPPPPPHSSLFLSLSFFFYTSTPSSTPPAASGLKFHREHENRKFDRARHSPRPRYPPSTEREGDVGTTDT